MYASAKYTLVFFLEIPLKNIDLCKCMKRFYYIIMIFGLFLLIFASCGPHGMMTKTALHKLEPKHNYGSMDTSFAPDYQLTESWLVYEDKNMPIDIFFIHPTSYKKNDQWNMALDDTATIARTYRRSIRRILSIFDNLGNVYAPKYRQATFYAFIDTKGNGQQAIDLARKDVLHSFDYYLKYINNGRPFILAAHSQGSKISMEILPIIYNDSNLRKQLIAAYVIGWPISLDYLAEHPEIEVCEDSLQTGCIISWNTETQNAGATIVDERSLCINPLNWKREEVYISNEKNQGAVFYLGDKPDTVSQYIGAQCKDGILKVDDIPNKDDLKGQYKLGLLHRFDYNFFYMNVKHNAQRRIETYLKSSD